MSRSKQRSRPARRHALDVCPVHTVHACSERGPIILKKVEAPDAVVAGHPTLKVLPAGFGPPDVFFAVLRKEVSAARRRELWKRIRDLSYAEWSALRELGDERIKDPDAPLFERVKEIWSLPGRRKDCNLGPDHVVIETSRDFIRDLRRRIDDAMGSVQHAGLPAALSDTVAARGFDWRWMLHFLYQVGASPVGLGAPPDRPVRRLHRHLSRFFCEALQASFVEIQSRKPRPRVPADAVTLDFLGRMQVPISRRYLRMILDTPSAFESPANRN